MDAEQKATVKMIAEARKLLTAALEKLDTIEQRIVAAPTERQVIKKVLTAFDELRGRRYVVPDPENPGFEKPEKYAFNGAADAAQVKRLLKTITKEELWQRMQAYIASNDEFYVKVRHSFGVFVKNINSLGGAQPLPLSAPGGTRAVRGCQHAPPCASEAQHTRRRTHDMRSV